jgi:hypothetical protein
MLEAQSGRLISAVFRPGLRPELMRLALCGYRRGDGRLPVASLAIEVSDSGQVGQSPEAHLCQSGPSCQVRPPRWYPECDKRRPGTANLPIGCFFLCRSGERRSRRSSDAFWRQAAPSGRDHVCATVEKTKRGASEKFFIPSGARSYAIWGLRVRTEFRHDSCNTAHR